MRLNARGPCRRAAAQLGGGLLSLGFVLVTDLPQPHDFPARQAQILLQAEPAAAITTTIRTVMIGKDAEFWLDKGSREGITTVPPHQKGRRGIQITLVLITKVTTSGGVKFTETSH